MIFLQQVKNIVNKRCNEFQSDNLSNTSHWCPVIPVSSWSAYIFTCFNRRQFRIERKKMIDAEGANKMMKHGNNRRNISLSKGARTDNSSACRSIQCPSLSLSFPPLVFRSLSLSALPSPSFSLSLTCSRPVARIPNRTR